MEHDSQGDALGYGVIAPLARIIIRIKYLQTLFTYLLYEGKEVAVSNRPHWIK